MALSPQRISGSAVLSRITPLVRDFVRSIRQAQTPREALVAIHDLLQKLQDPAWVVLTVISEGKERIHEKWGEVPEGFTDLWSDAVQDAGIRQMDLQPGSGSVQGRLYLDCPSQNLWEGIAPLLELASSEILERIEQQHLSRNSQILERLAQGLTLTQQPQDIAKVILTEGRKLLNVKVAAIFLITPDREHMQSFVWDGIQAETIQGNFGLFSLNADIPVARVARTGAAEVYSTRSEMLGLYPDVEKVQEKMVGTATASLPLITHNNILGTLYLGFSEERVFSLQERLWLETMAHQVAQAIERITLLERQTALLRSHEATIAQLKAIVDNTPMGLVLMDQQLRFLLINQRLADFNQKTVQEHLGRTMNEVYPDNEGIADRNFRKVLETGQPILDLEVVSRSYPDRFWLANYFPVYADHGALLGVGSTVQDITERKQTEKMVRESELRFQEMADTAPVMIWMSSVDGDTAFYNKSWLDFRGRTSEQELGTGWMEGIHPEDLEHCLQVFAQNAEHLQPFEMEFRLLRHDGEYRWIVDRGVPRFNEEGRFLGFVGACIDIHDRKLAQEGMERLMAAQKRFVADAAHELRTPLTSIQGNLDILFRYRDIEEAERQEILRDVQREASRLGRLVHDMLQLARGDAGATMREEEIDLRRITLNAWREMERISTSHLFEPGQIEDITTIGDADRLKQLVLILLENAVKYSPDGGKISLSLLQQDQMIHLTVQDSGQGISAEDLPRVFERFYRVDQSRHRSEDPGGTGLGLPIARWIVEGHQGNIWIESQLEKGTTVHVQLPLQE